MWILLKNPVRIHIEGSNYDTVIAKELNVLNLNDRIIDLTRFIALQG